VKNRRILVVDDSAAMRETIGVLLGRQYEVVAVAVANLEKVRDASFDLTIAPLTQRNNPQLPCMRCVWTGKRMDSRDDILPRRFTPAQLRRLVARGLDAPLATESSAGASNWRFDTPFLDAAAVAVVRKSASSGLALHIRGDPGAGKHTMARSIHEMRGGGPLILCDTDQPVPPAEELQSGAATVLAVAVDRWDTAAQRRLGELLSSPSSRTTRIISTATAELEELVDRGDFDTDLYYRLSLLRVDLVPLRERAEDIPAIAEALANEIAERTGCPHRGFTDAALERLSHYLWFGNLAELEAVLTRTLALAEGQRIDSEDLLFEGASITRAATAGAPVEQHSDAEPTSAGNLDLIIHELAHEFKNPLVTIKTFTQHCQHSLPAGSDDSRFAKLTGEAVGRIDDTLENLLAFTRMTQPALQNVPLATILDPIFGANRNGGGISTPVEYAPPPAVSAHVDPDQTRYAITNLIRALTRGSITHQPISVSFLAPDSLLCQLPYGSNSVGEKLAGMGSNGELADSNTRSIGVAMASTVLERNGAELSISKNSSPKTVMIRFPMVENEEAVANRDGKSTNIDC